MHYGRGAGQMPTASAVAGDIIEITRNIKIIILPDWLYLLRRKTVLDINQLNAEYYIRMTVKDRPGVLAAIAGVFGNYNVSLATVLQKAAEKMMPNW